MARLLKYTEIIKVFLVVFLFRSVFSFKQSTLLKGLQIQCGEIKLTIIVSRQFFHERRIPFKSELLRLGVNSTQTTSCSPKRLSENAMAITAGLRECGTWASVHGKWLVYSNQLFVFPAALPTSAGSLIVRGVNMVIPVECHYERKQKVRGEPLQPTWIPMTSTISAFGLLHFSLRVMTDGCSTLRSSSVYQQGETMFLEASVEALTHPALTLYVDYCVATLNPDPLSQPNYKFIAKHGCHLDSMLPGSSSRFLPRNQDNRLCFSVQAFHFNHTFGQQIFISCHLRAILKQNSQSHVDKACFFHRPTFSWRAIEGDSTLCECCDYDCFKLTKMNSGHTTQQPTEEIQEADRTVGPIHILHRSFWTGGLSVNN